MNDEQSIAPIANDLEEYVNENIRCDYSHADMLGFAKFLIGKGYGNVNEAVKEFAEFIISQMTDKCHRGCPYKQGTFTDVDMRRLANEFFEQEKNNAD